MEAALAPHANRVAMDGEYLALALTRLVAVVWESGLSNQSILVVPAAARQAYISSIERSLAGRRAGPAGVTFSPWGLSTEDVDARTRVDPGCLLILMCASRVQCVCWGAVCGVV